MDFGRLRYCLLHPATFLVVSTLLVIAGGNSLWERHHRQLRITPDQAILASDVVINAPGAWATPGVTRMVTEKVESLQTSLLDPHAVEKIASAIADVPAVEGVAEVRKHAGGVSVEALWRRPVAAIQMPGGYFRMLDRHGMVLDRQITNVVEAQQWLLIAVARPGGERIADWQIWQDSRVRSAAAIAGEIGDAGRELGLTWVFTYRKPEDIGPSVGTYELLTAKFAKVIWSDDGATKDEDLVRQRIAAIRAWVEMNGPLDTLLDRKLMLDVRSGSARMIPDQGTTQLSENGLDGILLF